MGFYDWKEEYSCGIKGIDNQHKVILELMAKLHNEIEGNFSAENMRGILVELLKYANYHFELELKLFKKYHYIDDQKHIEEHNHYIEKVKSFMIHGFLNSKQLPLETLEYLKKWFTNHMMKTDKD